jgi:hypothetical protein
MTKVYIKIKSYVDFANHKETSESAKLAKKIYQTAGIYPTGVLIAKICCECVETDHDDCSSYEDYLIYEIKSPNVVDTLLDADFEVYNDYDKFMDRFCELTTETDISDIITAI